MLEDVTVTHLDGDRAEVSYRETVATVQPNPHKAEYVALMARRKAGVVRSVDRERLERLERDFDGWSYTLPTGESYSHPSKRGALHMCRKWFVEAGIILVPFDHSHMLPGDRARAVGLGEARDRITGPRCGDFVQLAGHFQPVTRICGFSPAGGFALSPGGSWSLPGDPADLTPEWQSYSGGLDWRAPYRVADLVDSGRHEMGRFWFFSGGRMGHFGGVDVALPCRVYTLKGAGA